MTILEVFDYFAFAILPCSVVKAACAIKQQGVEWNCEYVSSNHCYRDVRIIYCSPDGPTTMPSVSKGLLLSEVNLENGPATLFVSSVNDGYDSMLVALSKRIPGTIINFRVSRMDLRYPGNIIQAYEKGQSRRTVYSIKEERGWAFWESGILLDFEERKRYLASRKRDRLNPEVVSRYLQGLGYASLERDFWISDHAQAHLLADRRFRPWCEPKLMLN